MQNDSLHNLIASVWRKHQRILHHLDRLGRILGELDGSETDASRSDSSRTGRAVEGLLAELRRLKRCLASEVRLNLPQYLLRAQPDFKQYFDSITRQGRALQEQLDNLIRLVTSSPPPSRGCGWSSLLSHFYLFGAPLRAYLVQRDDLLRRLAHSADVDLGERTRTAASAPAKAYGANTVGLT
jgi:hypothetical protein